MAKWNNEKTEIGELVSQLEVLAEAISDTISDYRRYQNAPSLTNINADESRMRMIYMRLRLLEGEKFPFDSLNTSLGKEKVFVFVVQDDKAVILEDSVDLFPSDTLITQLRLIQK